jgi:hypothetical protein
MDKTATIQSPTISNLEDNKIPTKVTINSTTKKPLLSLD